MEYDIHVKKTYPLLTVLTGFISFLVCGIVVGFLSLLVNEGLMLILGVPAGSLLMFFMLGKLNKGRILPVVIRSEIGGLGGSIAGFTAGSLVSGVISAIFPFIDYGEVFQSQMIPNMFVLIIADVVFGAVLGDLLFGRTSITYIALVCGIISIPFGLLLSIPVNMTWIPFDQNLLFVLTSFGTTSGLSIGLYTLRKDKK